MHVIDANDHCFTYGDVFDHIDNSADDVARAPGLSARNKEWYELSMYGSGICVPSRQLAEPSSNIVRLLASVKAARGTDDFNHGPESDAVAVRQTAPLEHRRDVAESSEKLCDESGLAQAGITDDRDEKRRLSVSYPSQRLFEDCRFRAPSDESSSRRRFLLVRQAQQPIAARAVTIATFWSRP